MSEADQSDDTPAEEADDETVIERRDIEDLSTNEEVDEAVDEMLDPSDLEDEEVSDPAVQKAVQEAEEKEEQGGTEVAVTGSSPDEVADDVENFDFEEQEWTLDEKREPEVKNIRGMKFLFKEPDDTDNVLNQLEQASNQGRDGQMRALVQMVVEKPEITVERWDGMSISAKLGLSGEAADYLDLDEGFLEE